MTNDLGMPSSLDCVFGRYHPAGTAQKRFRLHEFTDIPNAVPSYNCARSGISSSRISPLSVWCLRDRWLLSVDTVDAAGRRQLSRLQVAYSYGLEASTVDIGLSMA